MISLILAAGLASAQGIATPTITPRSINEDGVKAVYTQSVEADGAVHVKGFFMDRPRTPFHYVAKGRHVRGTVGRAEYAFQLPPR